MSDDIDRTDEYLELIADDRRREAATGNGWTDHIPLPTEPDEPPDPGRPDDEPQARGHRSRKQEPPADEPKWTFAYGAKFILDHPRHHPRLGWRQRRAVGRRRIADDRRPDGPGQNHAGRPARCAPTRPSATACSACPYRTGRPSCTWRWTGPPDRPVDAPPDSANPTAKCSPSGSVSGPAHRPPTSRRTRSCSPGWPSRRRRHRLHRLGETPRSGLSDDEVAPATTAPANTCSPPARAALRAAPHRQARRRRRGTHRVADIYGSAWITMRTGSIVMLSGEPGDPIVGLRHVRAPADQVGPYQLLHDPDAGTLTISHSIDLIELVAAAGFVGLTAKAPPRSTTPTIRAAPRSRRRCAGSTRSCRSRSPALKVPKAAARKHDGPPAGSSTTGCQNWPPTRMRSRSTRSPPVAEKQSRTNTHRSQNRRSSNHGRNHAQSNHATNHTNTRRWQNRRSSNHTSNHAQSRTYQSRSCVCVYRDTPRRGRGEAAVVRRRCGAAGTSRQGISSTTNRKATQHEPGTHRGPQCWI